jgi:hypothetical protein
VAETFATRHLPEGQLRVIRVVSAMLQKSFCGGEQKFLELLVRFTRGDVRDHIASSKIDHGSS